jgi:hypothetical protein
MKRIILILATMMAVQTGFGQFFSESFDSSSWPTGWTHEDFTIYNSSFAGGSAYEARLKYDVDDPNVSHITTPAIDTSGKTTLTLTWKQKADYYDGHGTNFVIKVQTSTDGTSFSDVWSQTVTEDEVAEKNVSLDASDGVGNSTFYIRWLYYSIDGNAFSYWNIDDITLIAPNDADTEVYDTGSQPAATTISSLLDSSGEAVDVFKMTIEDQGSGDGLATKVTNIRIKPHTTNTADWTDNIQGFVIDDGTNYITPASVNITDTYIDFAFNSGDLDVADGTSVDLNFAVYLNTSNIEDGKVLSFMVDADDHGFTADSSGSTFAASFMLDDFNSNDFTIAVEATELQFIQQPSNVDGGDTMTPAITVAYTDENGNVDVDYDSLGETAGLSATGATLSSSTNLRGTPINGIMTFNDIVFVTAGTGVTLTVTDDGYITNTTITSNTFDVTGAPEILIEGNATEIVDGDTTPDTTDDTDFGDVDYNSGDATHTFTIKNTGNVNLELTDASPYITMTGDTGDFSLTANPTTPIAANGSTTFDITFDPTTYGTRTVTISIANNDSDENPYTFDIQGNGTSTDEVDWGNLQSPETGNIRNGDTFDVYAQVYEPGVTEDADNSSDGITVWIGYSSVDNDPTNSANDADWTWVVASYNVDANDNDEYKAEIGSSLAGGTYYYASRFQLNGGPYKYGGYSGGFWDHTFADNTGNKSGQLTIDVVDWCNLENPHHGSQILGAAVYNVNARIYEEDLTTNSGEQSIIHCWIGISTTDASSVSDFTGAGWTWIAATYDGEDGNDDKYYADIMSSISTAGTYYYVTRFQINSGPYSYGGTNSNGLGGGDFWDGSNYVSGTLTALEPQEIDIKGNGISITNGSSSPTTADATDFANVRVDGSTRSHTFTIFNYGDADLNLSGSPVVNISGTNASDFTVTTAASTPVAGDSSTTFIIEFDPSDYGTRTATVSIDNNDSDENPYTFDIQGTGVDYTDCTGVAYIQDYESSPASPELTYTQTTYPDKSSNISASLYPSGEDYFVSGSDAIYINNHEGTISFNTIDTRNFNDITFSIRVASFSGTSGNGADLGDHVEILVSTDDGANWSEEVEVTGNTNAKWSFNTGTGIAKIAYDGDNSKTTFTPAGGGYRTTDGYSTMTITDLPSVEKLKIKIFLKNNSDNEYWILDDAKLTMTKSTTWDGAVWSDSAPTSLVKAIIDGDYATATNGGNISTCACQINSGNTLTVGAGEYLLVESDITNEGTIVVEHEGSLIQHNDLATIDGAGTYQIQKTTTSYNEYDYTYWSSPVDNETIGSVFAANPADYIFTLNPANFDDSSPADGWDDDTNEWIAASGATTMTPGVGYIAMGEGADFPVDMGNLDPATTQSVVFDGGKVNNGTITVSVVDDANLTDAFTNQNLIGNPYPSGIDADKFIAANTDLEGTLYFWTHNTAIAGNAGPEAYDYTNDDYATYVSGTGSAASSGGVVPTGVIASGQGFLANINNGGGTITFNNAMRVTTQSNTFFRRADNTEEKDRFWLNMTGDEGVFRQLLIGFFDEATEGHDKNYDGKRLYNSGYFDFYSILNNQRYAIQGFPSFTEDRIIPLGVEIPQTGLLKISIDHLEGLFTNQTIYLKDYVTGALHNLSQSDYEFDADETGVFENRFELRFTNDTLGIDDDILSAIAVYPNPSTGIFTISLQADTKINIEVFDSIGREVLNKTNTHNHQIDLTDYSKGIYFVKISIEGKQLVKKIVLK